MLADRGDEVTAVIRGLDHAAEVSPAGAEPLVADIEQFDVDGLARLIAGHDVVVWLAGAGGGNPARTVRIDRDAAIRSMAGAGEHLRASKLDWTVLGPRTLALESGSGCIDTTAETSAQTSRANVAAVIAETLADSGTIHRTIRFNDGETEIAEALHPAR
ncbi:NAD(P)H-binding protein [Leucobacter coleopterorum]|uniref:NAD(P)H-binding protein n=1 Tax=Leucobacter coleopterorum TaxID=2714933 RepID=A0ABX6K0F2_9MICO|nr:NAD(P)H-binding protein [Leucobacter coleopterorum]QIM19666.1 NAD(P)H-binding protein [Leucobacter coleopterorum]